MEWQRDQAQLAHNKDADGSGGRKGRDKSADGMLEAAAQEVFRVALFAVFFLQVSAVAFVPVVGASAPL